MPPLFTIQPWHQDLLVIISKMTRTSKKQGAGMCQSIACDAILIQEGAYKCNRRMFCLKPDLLITSCFRLELWYLLFPLNFIPYISHLLGFLLYSFLLFEFQRNCCLAGGLHQGIYKDHVASYHVNIPNREGFMRNSPAWKRGVIFGKIK